MLLQILLPVTLVLSMAASAVGQDYELDPQKLNQRYNLIQNLVQAGIPRKGGHGYKAKGAPIGTQAKTFGAVLGAQYKSPAYFQQLAIPKRQSAGVGYGPVAGSAVYGTPKTYGGYDVNRLYRPRQAGGYGYTSNVPNYRTPIGYKLGGGVVHPILDNRNLYKPKTFGDIYGNVNSQEPIYLGGSTAGFVPRKDAVVPVRTVSTVPAGYPRFEPQFNAYNYAGQPQGYAGRDVVGGYTGQKGTLYGGLPGYTNQQFSTY